MGERGKHMNTYNAGTDMGFPGGSVVKNPPASAGDRRDEGLSPGS